MARCAFCEARKGKRSCPALGGMICASCCGENRLRTIDCPPDCPWLGGLSAIADRSAADMKIPDEAWDSAQDLLFSSLGRGRGRWFLDAAERVFGLREHDPENWERLTVISYAALVARDAEGKRHVDRVFDANARDLDPAQAATLESFRRSWPSLFEVKAIDRGVGLDLLDIFTGEVHSVSEVSLATQVSRGDILLAWLGRRDGEMQLTSAVCLLPPDFADQIVEEIIDKVAELRHDRPDTDAHQLVAELSWVTIARIKQLTAGRRPELRTTDGDQMLWCEARFEVSDPVRVRDELARCPDIDHDDEDFVWLEPDGGAGFGEMPRILGAIAIQDDELVLTTQSHPRLDRGRAMLEERLGSLISHWSTTAEPIEDLLDRPAADEEPPVDDLISDDVKRDTIGRMLRRHYTAWLDDTLPALDGRTPREAARDPESREQVDRMLDDIQELAAGMPGGETLDVTWMRDQLGLLDDLHAPDLTYDPEDAPDPDDWLALDEAERTRLVELAHASTPDVLDEPGSPKAHAVIHVVVENQIASGNPPIARATLDRLMAEGASRHAGVHAVGSVLAEMMHGIMKSNVPFDADKYTCLLEQLNADDWIAQPDE